MPSFVQIAMRFTTGGFLSTLSLRLSAWIVLAGLTLFPDGGITSAQTVTEDLPGVELRQTVAYAPVPVEPPPVDFCEVVSTAPAQDKAIVSRVRTFAVTLHCVPNSEGVEVDFLLNGIWFRHDNVEPFEWTVDTQRFVDGTHIVTFLLRDADDVVLGSQERVVLFRNFFKDED